MRCQATASFVEACVAFFSRDRWRNSPFPSCYMPQFHSESRCKTIQMEMSLICIRILYHFHLNGLAPGLAMKLRHVATRKWAIDDPLLRILLVPNVVLGFVIYSQPMLKITIIHDWVPTFIEIYDSFTTNSYALAIRHVLSHKMDLQWKPQSNSMNKISLLYYMR